ncbi:MAG: zinc ribbon domain-containing protein [bacterium]|nr:zinc ribbon domain-containing protein [bacterium]
MSQDNYYILLGLQIAPPENDNHRIALAIEEKQGQWSQDCLNGSPSRARKAEAYLEQLPEIKQTMADPKKRGKHAMEAIEIEKKKFEKIDEAIKLGTLAGSITQEELSELAQMLAVDEAVIRDRLKVPIVEAKEVVQRLDSSLYRKITGNLKTIEKKSLYDFLDRPAGTEPAKLLARAETIAAELKTESNKDTKYTARNTLIGNCYDLFETEEMRRRYDASLAYQSLDELNKYINIAGFTGIIRAEAFEMLMKKAADIEIEANEAEEHILAYCEEKKWRVRMPNRTTEIKTPCPHCDALNTPGTKKCAACGKPLKIKHHTKEKQNPFANNGTPIIPYGISKVLIGLAGIVLTLISAIPLLKIFITMLKANAYAGNGPYLAATLLTFGICITIVAWGLKTLLSGHKEIKEYSLPDPTDAEIFADAAEVLTKKKVQPHQTALEKMLKRDKAFIKGYFVFIGMVVLFFIVKVILPDTFFWNLRLNPQYFTYPFLLTIILALAAGLRYASIYFHTPNLNREIEGSEIRETINATAPEAFEPGIKNALHPIQQEGKPNKVVTTGLGDTGGKQGSLLVETNPQPVPLVRPAFIYLYIVFAILLTGVGIFLMTQHPPDNISVLTVPTIAIGYTWTILKGGMLALAGAVFLADVSRLYRTGTFRSVMVYVGIKATGGSEYQFNVLATTLSTEMGRENDTRQIIKMSAGKDSEKAKQLVANAIETFK